MQSKISKPLFVYDGDCDFCRYWIDRWKHLTQDRIDYAPYQHVATEFPDIPITDFQTSVKLILENGQVYSGAEAVFCALNNSTLLWCYYNLPGFKFLCESAYSFVARHRQFLSKVTRSIWRTHQQ